MFQRLLCIGAVFTCLNTFAQPKDTISEESKIPPYNLPDPLVMQDGKKVSEARGWKEQRRPEIMGLFEKHIYGKTPTQKPKMTFKTVGGDSRALGGKAIRKEVSTLFGEKKDGPKMDLLIYLPANATKPVPAFLGLNFDGNHSVTTDPAVKIPTAWMRNNAEKGIENNRASEAGRGKSTGRWPIEMVLARGYAVVTAYCGDLDPDYHDGFKNGVHPLFYKEGQTEPAADEWGTIGAWAWGLSRALDYLETDPQINAKRVFVHGHSRLGKAALWAGAQDERFAIVISNNSGCGGAALSKRVFGEAVHHINKSFPHWFCSNFKKYDNNEAELPVDQHMLIAAIAPRPVYINSAEEDSWADPKGEFLSGSHADPVYRLLGTPGLPAREMPALNKPVMGQIGYHVRSGKHDVLEYDWEQWMKFAESHFGPPTK